jgi:N-acetyl-anhydromuramyl-L-alanine amidase AmpD
MDDLAAMGYDTSLPAAAVITAFQRRFLPEHLTGEADEQTEARAAAVVSYLQSA